MKTKNMDDDDTDNVGWAAIESVENQDESNKDIEDGPKTGTEEKVDDETLIDEEAKWAQDNKEGNI